MNSETIYPKLELLHNWLKDQKFMSNVVLPKSLSWASLEEVTGRYIPPKSGFYVVRRGTSIKDNSDIVYIGESEDLNRRIGFLKGAIRRGTAPHSGGRTLSREFGPLLSQFEICWLVTTNVYMAKFFERYLVLSFYEEHNRLPVGNKE